MIAINEFYDREYNARAQVDDVTPYFERWEQESAAARQSLRADLNRAYGERKRETIDLFPAGEQSRWLVFIHGGYWRVMTKEHFSFIAPPFVERGLSVAVIEYDLCPAVTMQTITEQCRRGIAWLVNQTSCEQVIISGHSAGGHLTAMMFATDWTNYGVDSGCIRGGIALSGLFDLDPLSQTRMNSDLKLDHESIRALSPARLSPQIDAPLVVASGALESSEFHRQGEVLCGSKLWQDITEGPLLIADCHHFNILDDFMKADSPVWTAADLL